MLFLYSWSSHATEAKVSVSCGLTSSTIIWLLPWWSFSAIIFFKGFPSSYPMWILYIHSMQDRSHPLLFSPICPDANQPISLHISNNLLPFCYSNKLNTPVERNITQNHRKIWQFQILVIPSSSLTQSVRTNINCKASSARQTGQWGLQLRQTVDLPTLSKSHKTCQLLCSWRFVVKQPGMVCFITSRQILLLKQLEGSMFYFWLPKRNLVVFHPPGNTSFTLPPPLLYSFKTVI